MRRHRGFGGGLTDEEGCLLLAKPAGYPCGPPIPNRSRQGATSILGRTVADRAEALCDVESQPSGVSGPDFSQRCGTIAPMSSRRKDNRGRPSIGQPEMVWGRVSVECRSRIDDLADKYGVSKSRIVAALLAVGLDNLDQLKLPVGKPTQEELPLVQAS